MKVPSSFFREPRFWMGMRTPLGCAMGVAEAMSARATEMRAALQNMVAGLRETRGERANKSEGLRADA